jgi:hypothetical protein
VVTAVDQPLYVLNGTWVGILRDPWNLSVGESLFDPITEHWVLITVLALLTAPETVYDLSTGGPPGSEGYIANGLLVFSKV